MIGTLKTEVKQKVDPAQRKDAADRDTRKTQIRQENSRDQRRSERREAAARAQNHQREERRHKQDYQNREKLEELGIRQITANRNQVEAARQRIVSGIKSAIQRAIARPTSPDEEKLSALKQNQAKGLAEHLAQAKSTGLQLVKSQEPTTVLGQAQALAQRAEPAKNVPAHNLVRQMMRNIELGGETTQASRQHQRDYKVWTQGRDARPNINALIARGKQHEEIKRSMAAHVEMAVFTMLNIWSVFFRRLQKRFKEYEENTGEEATLIPRNFAEIVSQIRFARNLDVKARKEKKAKSAEERESNNAAAREVESPSKVVEQEKPSGGVVVAA